MNGIVKVFLWGIALSIGLAVGDAVGDGIRDSYKEHKAKSRKQDPSVIVTDDAQEVKVSND